MSESKPITSGGRKEKGKMQQKKMVEIFLAIVFMFTVARCAWAQDGPKKLLVAYAGLISTHTSVWLGEEIGRAHV